MTTTTTKKKKSSPREPPKKPEASRARARGLVALGLGASVALAFFAGHRGAAYFGDTIGTSLAKLVAPSRRHVKDIYGIPREGAPPDTLGHVDGADGGDSSPRAPAVRLEGDGGAPTSVPARTRGVLVPGSVVVAYARRGAIPAVDTVYGPMLRGVGRGNGLEDGDIVVRVGRAPVRSLREITGIVQASLFAGHTHIHGTIRRGEEEIDVTVEIPVDGDAGP